MPWIATVGTDRFERTWTTSPFGSSARTVRAANDEPSPGSDAPPAPDRFDFLFVAG